MGRKEQKSKHGKNDRISKTIKPKKKSIIKSFINQIILTILLFIIVIGAFFCWKTYDNGWGIKGALMTAFFITPEQINELDTINIVLLGISEDLNSRLTDTIIVCSYNPKTSEASMISIPRDTFVGSNIEAAKGSDKLNVIFSKNKKKFLDTISKIIGIDIDYYAVVNNDAVIKIVDIMGGVNFDVPIDMNYDDPTQDLHIHIKKGMQLIDGEKAEQLLRFRHNNDGSSYPASYGDNDFGRMKTQRKFIEEMVRQAISIKNIIKAKRIYNVILENIDTNYDIKDVKKYIPTLADFNFDKITNVQLPGKSEKHNEFWFYIYDSNKTKELVKDLNIK